MNELTDSIYVTIGADQIKEKGYRKVVEDFLMCDGDIIYHWKISNTPDIKKRKNLVWAYIVIGNKVRWKAKIISFVDNQAFHFLDGRSMWAKGWMMLIDFEKLPAPYEHKKGFQGFRYKN